MINQNDDPLIAEIEKMHSEMRQLAKTTKDKTILYTATARANIVAQVLELVKADRARQQAEKEKVIADVDALLGEHRKPFRDTYDYGVYEALQIIQGKEQKEGRAEKE